MSEDTEFVYRLETAMNKAPGVPERVHGRLSWLMREIQNRTGEPITLESVRRWFIGRSKPHGANLQALADILACDPGWLAFGATPVGTRTEQVRGSARATGAVYYVLGRMLLEGIMAGLPRENDALALAAAIDIEAIIDGVTRRFTVSQAELVDGQVGSEPIRALVARPRMPSINNEHLIVVPAENGNHRVIHLPASLAGQAMVNRGEHADIHLMLLGNQIRVARELVGAGGEMDRPVEVRAVARFSGAI